MFITAFTSTWRKQLKDQDTVKYLSMTILSIKKLKTLEDSLTGDVDVINRMGAEQN